MKVIFKIIYKNINNKKIRSLLIILTLMLITTVMFISMGTKNTTEKIVMETSKKYVGNADILMQIKNTSKLESFNVEEEKESKDYEYAIGVVDLNASLTKDNNKCEEIVLRGINLDDLQKNTETNIEEINSSAFVGNKVIVSNKFAEKNNLKVGDFINVSSKGNNERLKVFAIFEAKGIFLEDGETSFVIVPIQYLQNRLNIGNRVNKLLIKLKEPEGKNEKINKLKDKYDDLEVREAIVQSDIDTVINNQTSPYKIITVVVILLSIVIISYIFKIISIERIPIIGTLRSIGANKKIALIILLVEALYYSVIASILGCLLGIGCMNLILQNTVPDNLKNLNIGVEFTVTQFLLSAVVTIGVAVIGSIIPTIKISKYSIKNVIFGIEENKNKESSILKLIVSIIFISIAVFTPRTVVSEFKMEFEILALVFLIIGIILFVPYAVKFVTTILNKCFIDVGNNMIYMSINNFKNNKNILSNIILLTISLSTFILVSSITNSVVNDTDDLYRDNAKFDMFVWYDSTNENTNIERLCQSNSNVKSLYTTLISYDHSIDGTNYKIEKLQGADTNNYFNYWNVKLKDGKDINEIKEDLNNERNVIITSVMKERLGVELGDSIPLYFGKNIIKYKVIGFMDSINTNGNNAIISEKYFKQDVKDTYYNDVCLNVDGNIDTVKNELINLLPNNGLTIETIYEMENKNYENYRGIYSMLKILSLVVLLVSVIGMANNQLINFIQRKKHFSIQKSIGMSKKQLSQMLLIEAVVSGVIGGVIALAGGNLLIYIIPNFLKANGQVLNINYSISSSILAIVIGAIITIICSIMTIIKSSNLSIIESIRYE